MYQCYFIINHQPSTINHQPSTINHQPSTINHQPSTIKCLCLCLLVFCLAFADPGWNPFPLKNETITSQTYNQIVNELNVQLKRAWLQNSVETVTQGEILNIKKYNLLLKAITDLTQKNASANFEYQNQAHLIPSFVKKGDIIKAEQFEAIRQVISATKNNIFSKNLESSCSFTIPADGTYKLTLAGGRGGNGGKGGNGGRGSDGTRGNNGWSAYIYMPIPIWHYGGTGGAGGAGASGTWGVVGQSGYNGQKSTIEKYFKKGTILSFTIGAKGADGANGSNGADGGGLSGGKGGEGSRKDDYGDKGKGGNGGAGGNGGGGGGGGSGTQGRAGTLGESGWTGSNGNDGDGYLKIEW